MKRSAIVYICVCGTLIIPQPALKPRKFNCLFIKAITTYNQYKTVPHIVCILDSDATAPRSDDLSKQWNLGYPNLHYPNPRLSERYYECRIPKNGPISCINQIINGMLV